MVEEFDTAAVIESQQFEHDHTDRFEPTEKQILKQRLLDMESLLGAVVHNNTNLRARLEGLEGN